MELVRLESQAHFAWPRPAVTVGNFDGVHRGHQSLVAAAIEEARVLGGTSVALTLEPHPARVLTPDRAPATLMTHAQKTEALAALGVDVMAVLPFTLELAGQSPEGFATLVLGERLVAEVVVVGYNFRFGRGRSGDLGELVRLGDTIGFRVRGIEPVQHEGAPISSTRIREALSRGDVRTARDLLGRRFFVDGSVVSGAGRGRGLGIPTANLNPTNETLPQQGVYAGWSGILDEDRPSWRTLINVGHRPTFGGGELVVEAHILDLERDLYGSRMRIEFEERLRGEHGFANQEALRVQIDRDIGSARRLLEKP